MEMKMKKTFLAAYLAFALMGTIAPNRANASADDDKKAVAALDTQYQAAVEKNDAANMDRFLADDFILVTGNGKAYTKADLLKEAQSGHAVYEHQSDTEQTVRVWGDTAVVTAKLWEKGRMESLSTRPSGSATPTSALPQDGATCLAKPRWRYPRLRSHNEIAGHLSKRRRCSISAASKASPQISK
jgi:ketosteroid isomerase-like protein